MKDVIPYSVERAFGVTIRSCTAVSGGFSGAVIVRATTDDDRDLAIRRTPGSIALPPERVKQLYDLLLRMSQSGCGFIPVPLLPVCSPLSGRHSNHDFDAPWLQENNNFWQVEPWMPGAPLFGAGLTAQHVNAGLKALNELHQTATRAVDLEGSDNWFHNANRTSPAVQRRLGIVSELTSGLLEQMHLRLSEDPDIRFRSLAERVCKTLRTRLPQLHHELSAVASMTFSVQPVLRDVWRAHVLFTGTQVTGIIDLSASASDHVTVDVTRLIRSWFGSDSSRVRDAVEGFQSLRTLNASEIRLMQVLDATTVLLSPVTWLRRRMDSGSTAACADDVIARLAELADVAETFSLL